MKGSGRRALRSWVSLVYEENRPRDDKIKSGKEARSQIWGKEIVRK